MSCSADGDDDDDSYFILIIQMLISRIIVNPTLLFILFSQYAIFLHIYAPNVHPRISPYTIYCFNAIHVLHMFD